jgi:pantothenate kinase
MDTLAERLYRRWIDLGLDAETARAKVSQNDLVNAAFVVANRSKPDLLASY